MKESERLINLVQHFKDEGIAWGVKVYGPKIWHGVLKFDDGIYCRGYSILADMDRSLPMETRIMRGQLISLGRALKAYDIKGLVAPVTNPALVDLLISRGCPWHRHHSTEENTAIFYKGQYNIFPTQAERWMVQQPNEPAYAPNKPHSLDRDAILRDFIQAEIARNKGPVEVSRLTRVYTELANAMALYQKELDVRLHRMQNLQWLRENGFTMLSRVCVDKL
jgi:hypothetical protein